MCGVMMNDKALIYDYLSPIAGHYEVLEVEQAHTISTLHWYIIHALAT